MKHFRFRLQRILDLRAAAEEQKLTLFGREQVRLRDEQQKLEMFRNEQQTQMLDVAADRQTPFSAWSQTATSRYLVRVARVIEFQTGRVEHQVGQMEAARRVYLNAHRDTTILERLHDKRQDEWTKDMLRDEGKTLDEIGSQARNREEMQL